MLRSSWFFVLALAITAEGAALGAEPPLPAQISFNRDIKPILADNCYACHGPDRNSRQAELRLDTQAGLFGEAAEGHVVAPKDLEQSELWRRITSDDAEQKMPPAGSGKELTGRQKAMLKAWIEQGAPWQGHWAFLPIERPAVPSASEAGFSRNAIDAFVLAKQAEQGVAHAPPAERSTLVRRLNLDLLGLPPDPRDVAAFEAAADEEAAYAALVEKLLASPHYGERLAEGWLDLVRYGDSVGYHGDQAITMWPYRDYVIVAFNANKRFDQFTLEQLAGDLLTNATREQKIAASYNRLNMMSAEGGGQDKEYLAKYAADRVRATSGAWLGVTMGCCECHDHKFDPLATRDFYRFAAFFADVTERGIYGGANDHGGWGPMVALPTPDQEAAQLRVDAEVQNAQKAFDEKADGLSDAQREWEAAKRAELAAIAAKPEAEAKAERDKILPAEIASLVELSPDARNAEQQAKLAEHFRNSTPLLSAERDRLAAATKAKNELEQQITRMPATVAGEPRTMRVLPRGNWMDDSGDVVLPGVPAALPQPKLAGERATRLDLARWMTSRENPLVARVFVNRLWKQFFGAGLSRRLDDLGTQGDPPSHAELLDWLAAEFIESGWDVKHVVRLMVTSGTYRQSSTATAAQHEADPFNRWLARQGRFRLDAELVRDGALATSGLLARQIGGPSAKPYQPPGYWAYLNFPAREWQNGSGDDLYRRGLYTHWQRQYLHPSLMAFDAPSREECTADRLRSNTPLQALALLNDPTYAEAARAFAERILREGGADTPQRLDWAFRQSLARPIRPAEAEALAALVDKHLAEYRRDPQAATAVQTNGARAAASDLDAAELAAWTSAARTILNLHATITRN
ncbi:MAG: PSD1 and planctomycete cytochrome C domain-containing protein [Pirellulales bacterium]